MYYVLYSICTVLNTKFLLQLCILITVSEIGQAFITMSPEEFEARYDFKRPEKDSQKPIGMCVLVESQKNICIHEYCTQHDHFQCENC